MANSRFTNRPAYVTRLPTPPWGKPRSVAWWRPRQPGDAARQGSMTMVASWGGDLDIREMPRDQDGHGCEIGSQINGGGEMRWEDSVMGWAWQRPREAHGGDRDHFGVFCWLNSVSFLCWCLHGRRMM